jgi:hypothetical protein
MIAGVVGGGRVGGVGREGAGIDLGKLRPAVRSGPGPGPAVTQATASSSYCRYNIAQGLAQVCAQHPGGLRLRSCKCATRQGVVLLEVSQAMPV